MKTSKFRLLTALLLAFIITLSAGCAGNGTTTTESGTTSTCSEASSAAVETSDVTSAPENVTSSEPSSSSTPAKNTSSVSSAVPKIKPNVKPSASSGVTTSNDGRPIETGSSDKDSKFNASALIPANLKIQPALWKATDPETGGFIYMLGTIHIAAENTYPLPAYIEDVYAGCDSVAVEYDVDKLSDPDHFDQAAVQEYSMAMVYNDGTIISDHIAAATYKALKSFVDKELGGWNDIYNYYNIGSWINTLESYQIEQITGFDLERGIDRYFISKAKADGKSVLSIETLSVQTSAINSYTDRLGDYVIQSYLDNADETELFAQDLVTLYSIWASGDIEGIGELNEVSDDGDLPADLTDDIKQHTWISHESRNVKMAEHAAAFIENGENVFFMVGAAHFAGEKGIPALLTGMGYTVERIK